MTLLKQHKKSRNSLGTMGFMGIVIAQGLVIFFLIWLLLTNKGTPGNQQLGTKEHQHTQPFRFAAQTALPAVVYLFKPAASYFCDPKANKQKDQANTLGPNTECTISNKNKRNLGSAVIIQSNGVLITSYHVVKNINNIYATLDDGRNLRATLITSDPSSDLAFLKIDAQNLASLPLKPSTDVEIGDAVLAIGNPFSLGKSVSMGIVSALNKSHLGVNKVENFIQTDAAVNPGDSGGALVNLKGELIGINSAIYSQNEAYTGIAFAVPVALAIRAFNNFSTPQKRSK